MSDLVLTGRDREISDAGASPQPLSVPWRDPQTVPRDKVRGYIKDLERACAENPESAELRTCLGMVHAMNYDAYSSLDALEAARKLDPQSFWAQMKYAELMYRLRALPKSEVETLAALELANSGRELATAKAQLLEIRRLMREGTQKPAWTKPLPGAALALAAIAILLCLLVTR